MRNSFPKRAVLAALLIIGVGQQAACMEHQVGGKTAEEVFDDPRLAAMARASCEGDAEAVVRAVQAGADPNGRGYGDTSPLMWAITCENLRGMEALLKAGADPNARFGTISPTYAAATRHNPAPLKLLLRHGGDPNAREEGGSRTALIEAVSLGINELGWDNYYALLDAGADINLADERGDTIAIAEADFAQFDKVAELLERGYEHDLPALAKAVHSRVVDPKHPQASWQEKVIGMLEARGVEYERSQGG